MGTCGKRSLGLCCLPCFLINMCLFFCKKSSESNSEEETLFDKLNFTHSRVRNEMKNKNKTWRTMLFFFIYLSLWYYGTTRRYNITICVEKNITDCRHQFNCQKSIDKKYCSKKKLTQDGHRKYLLIFLDNY